MNRPPKEVIERLTKELADRGLLIEAGWKSLQLAVLPVEASQTQIAEMRMAFFAGAQHLFSSIMTTMDETDEPSLDDLRRMDLINAELKKFAESFAKRVGVDPP